MAFNSAVLTEVNSLPAGEVITEKPHNIDIAPKVAADTAPGVFVEYDDGTYKTLSAINKTPVGVLRRQVASEMGDGKTLATDLQNEIVNFGYVTVKVTAGQSPAKYGAVYAQHTTGEARTDVDSDKGVIVPGATFWEEIQTGVWLIRLGQII